VNTERIVDIETRIVVVPLPRPVAWSNVRVTHREFLFVWLRTEGGAEGMGFTVGSRFPGGARVIRAVVDEVLRPVLAGSDPAEIERLWEECYFRGLLLGTRGALMRALSAVDIALWDLQAKRSDQRLCDLLGRYRETVPAYASGGYYYDDDPERDLELLEEEIHRHVALGFRDVKIKVGRRDWREEIRRVERVLAAAGPGARVAVDANHAWRDVASAVNDLRAIDDLGLWWIEEPFLPDQIEPAAQLAKKLTTPLATGEIEAGRWAFRAIESAGAAAIFQTDATVAGGVSEWLKIAGFAAACDLPLAPHWVPYVHVQLGAASPAVLTVEYFDEATGVLGFDALLARPLEVRDGAIAVPPGPGHGIELDMEAIDHYEEGVAA
jgi:D-arabinonate dehydratase